MWELSRATHCGTGIVEPGNLHSENLFSRATDFGS